MKRWHIALTSDEYRVPLQTTAAVLLAFGATFFMGTDNMSWGVFSALFVVQASIGGTISTGLQRIAGAVLGAVLGVGAVLLPGNGIAGTLISLVVGVGSMSLVSVRWPQLAYGLVTVTIIIVAPDFYVVEGALEKIAAIGIGSLCGMVAAVSVLPVSARRQAEQHLSQALRACGRLLDECVHCLVDGQEHKAYDADADISYALSRARDMSNQAQAERASIAPSRVPPFGLFGEVERFRYTLTLIDRFSDHALPEELRHEYGEGLRAWSEAVNLQIVHLADAIVARTSCEPVPDFEECFARLCKGVDEALQHHGMRQADRERLIAVKEACAAMLQNLRRLCERVSEQYGLPERG